MTTSKHEIRRGVYYDSVVLMQLQRALAALAEVPPSPARDELEAVVNLVIERQK